MNVFHASPSAAPSVRLSEIERLRMFRATDGERVCVNPTFASGVHLRRVRKRGLSLPPSLPPLPPLFLPLSLNINTRTSWFDDCAMKQRALRA